MNEPRNDFERIAEASERAQGHDRTLFGGLDNGTTVGRMIALRLILLGLTLVAGLVAAAVRVLT